MAIEDTIIKYGELVAELLFRNPEVTAALIGFAVIFIRSRFNGRWPMLFHLRRGVIPYLSIWLQSTKIGNVFSIERKIWDTEFVGTYRITPTGLNRIFRTRPNIYPDNVAKLKWRNFTGIRQYEFASWAHREQGFLGKYQTHLIAFDNEDGTIDLYAHYEYNPYSRPIRHYRDGHQWDADEGVEIATEIMEEIMARKGDDEITAHKRAKRLNRDLEEIEQNIKENHNKD